jgi:hypothetical protein
VRAVSSADHPSYIMRRVGYLDECWRLRRLSSNLPISLENARPDPVGVSRCCRSDHSVMLSMTQCAAPPSRINVPPVK